MMKKVIGIEIKEKFIPYCITEDGDWDVEKLMLNGERTKESYIFISALGVVKAVAKKAIAERFPNHVSRSVGMLFDDDGVSKQYVVRFCVGAYDTKVDVVVDTRGDTYINEEQAEKVYQGSSGRWKIYGRKR